MENDNEALTKAQLKTALNIYQQHSYLFINPAFACELVQ